MLLSNGKNQLPVINLNGVLRTNTEPSLFQPMPFEINPSHISPGTGGSGSGSGASGSTGSGTGTPGSTGGKSSRQTRTEVIKYTYDGWDVIREDHSVNGVTLYQNGLGVDDKLRSKNGTTVRYFLTDHLSSTVALTDASGAITSSTSYDSFGNATTNIPTSYQYTGREYDSDTGLYYYRNRWYDPEIGRFISEDPIEFAGDDINLYGYVWNNLLMYKDFFGLQGHKPKKKPKAAERSAMDNSLQNRLQQQHKGPEFQQPENLNPLTANSAADFAKAQTWSGIKNALKGPQGTMGVVGGTIEVGPSLAVTLDALARRNHDIESLTKYAAGESEHPYTEYKGDAPSERFYEDLNWVDKLICNVWGSCPPSKKDPAVCATRC